MASNMTVLTVVGVGTGDEGDDDDDDDDDDDCLSFRCLYCHSFRSYSVLVK